MQAIQASPQNSRPAAYAAYVEWSAAKAANNLLAARTIAVQTVLDRFGWAPDALIEIRTAGRRLLSATLRQAIESLAPLDLARCLREPARQVQQILRGHVEFEQTAFLVRLDDDRAAEQSGAVDHAAEKIAQDIALGLRSGAAAGWAHWNGSDWIDIDLSKLPGVAAIRKAEG